MKHKVHVGLDTDLFFDPDDLFALLYALNNHELSVDFIITNDEIGTARAQVLKGLLKELQHPDTPIAAGKSLGNRDHFLFQDKTNGSDIRKDYVQLVKDVVTEPAEFTYIGLGSLSNMAEVIKDSQLKKMRFIQMGGAINYRKPGRAEHNFSLHLYNARTVVYSGVDLSLVLSDSTYKPDILGVGVEHSIYQRLKYSDAPGHQLLIENCDRFYKRCYPQTIMHDPLTVSTAFCNFVPFKDAGIIMDPIGNIVISQPGEGHMVKLSQTPRYHEFMNHMEQRLFA